MSNILRRLALALRTHLHIENLEQQTAIIAQDIMEIKRDISLIKQRLDEQELQAAVNQAFLINQHYQLLIAVNESNEKLMELQTLSVPKDNQQ